MKKLMLLLLLVGATLSAQTGKMKFSGKIENRNGDVITITGKNLKQTIPVNKDGSFSASFDVSPGLYQFYDGFEYTEMFLKPGMDLRMKMDAKQFDESIVYSGKGEKENNILARKVLDEEVLEEKVAGMANDQQSLMKLVTEYQTAFSEKISAPGVDPALKAAFDEQRKEAMAQQAEQQKKFMEMQAGLSKLDGTTVGEYTFENYNGGSTKMSGLKGKYVYIDTWATWCGPCLREIPHLQKVEEQYHGKNIEFVSISIDEKKDYDKWKNMVDSKKLGGVQLYADNAWNSQFCKDFSITSIPRFILIDPTGKVISANAPRPSSPELTAQLDKLLN